MAANIPWKSLFCSRGSYLEHQDHESVCLLSLDDLEQAAHYRPEFSTRGVRLPSLNLPCLQDLELSTGDTQTSFLCEYTHKVGWGPPARAPCLLCGGELSGKDLVLSDLSWLLYLLVVPLSSAPTRAANQCRPLSLGTRSTPLAF